MSGIAGRPPIRHRASRDVGRGLLALLGGILATGLGGCDGPPDPGPDLDRSAYFGRLVHPGAADSDEAVDFHIILGTRAQPWQALIAAAGQRHAPGRLSTLVGARLTVDSAKPGPILVFRSLPNPQTLDTVPDPAQPEVLWQWMDALRDAGIESLVVGDPQAPGARTAPPPIEPAPRLDNSAAERRWRNAPLLRLDTADADGTAADVALDVWSAGLAVDAVGGFNPYQVGLVADGNRALTGVWAPHNDRTGIYDALRRRETFVTSGRRIALRLTADGVPMGGDLLPSPSSPLFMASAVGESQDPPLGLLQIIKGWEADGLPRWRRYDVACGNGEPPDPTDARCPAAPDDAPDCGSREGARTLSATWRDPDFQPEAEAVYLLAASEVSRCAGASDDPGLAWSSPIWYHGGRR